MGDFQQDRRILELERELAALKKIAQMPLAASASSTMQIPVYNPNTDTEEKITVSQLPSTGGGGDVNGGTP